MDSEIYTKVAKIIADVTHLELNKITPESNFDSLGVDSIDRLEIIMKIEEQFGIEISDEAAAKINTVQEAVDKISQMKK
jgi:acyl carrier protein